MTDTEGAEVHYYKSLRRDEVIAGMSTPLLYIIEFLTWGKPKQALNWHHLPVACVRDFKIMWTNKLISKLNRVTYKIY